MSLVLSNVIYSEKIDQQVDCWSFFFILDLNHEGHKEHEEILNQVLLVSFVSFEVNCLLFTISQPVVCLAA